VDKTLTAGLVLAFAALLLVVMVVAWRARQRRQRHLPTVQQPPADVGEVFGEFDGLYVATTVADQPLERVVVGGLGFRARAGVQVAASGITLSIAGEAPVFIAAASLRAVTRATWAIDRVVEEGGLVLIAWNLGQAPADEAPIDSYLRVSDSDALLSAISRLIDSPLDSPTGITQ
jgi:hypothetical protein